MIVLALDSATSRGSLALRRDGEVVAATILPEGGQGDALALHVEALLAGAGIRMGELGLLAATIGPGRFTGLRAGLAFMRGLSLALGVPVAGVTTLAALRAATACAAGEVPLACVDSRRAEFFFPLGAGGTPFACRAAELAARIAPGTRIVAVGERAEEAATALSGAGRAARAVPRLVEAADVAAIAESMERPVGPPAPLYIHPPATTAPRATRRAAR
ncbi:MAG: tRNA (adenosine(37)-N6)-threonylcarbamoyltransferase complex dimerization subunit type 1 TsaB [Alphaproteobacteria bacterium]